MQKIECNEELLEQPTKDNYYEDTIREIFTRVFDDGTFKNIIPPTPDLNPQEHDHNKVVKKAWLNVLKNMMDIKPDKDCKDVDKFYENISEVYKNVDEFISRFVNTDKDIGKVLDRQDKYNILRRLDFIGDFIEYWNNIIDISRVTKEYEAVCVSLDIGEYTKTNPAYKHNAAKYFKMVKTYKNNKCFGYKAKFHNWENNAIDVLEQDNTLINFPFDSDRLKLVAKAFDDYCVPLKARQLLTNIAPRVYEKPGREQKKVEGEYIQLSKAYLGFVLWHDIQVKLSDFGMKTINDKPAWGDATSFNKELHFTYVYEGFRPDKKESLWYDVESNRYYYNMFSKENLPVSITTLDNDPILRQRFMKKYGYTEQDMAARDVVGRRIMRAIDILIPYTTGVTLNKETGQPESDGLTVADYMRYCWQKFSIKVMKTLIFSGKEGSGKTSLSRLLRLSFDNLPFYNINVKVPTEADLPLENHNPRTHRSGYCGFQTNADVNSDFVGDKVNTCMTIREEVGILSRLGNSQEAYVIKEDLKTAVSDDTKRIHYKNQTSYSQPCFDNFLDITNHHLDIVPNTGWARRVIYTRSENDREYIIAETDKIFCEEFGKHHVEKYGIGTVFRHVKRLAPFYLEYIVEWLEQDIRPEIEKALDNEDEIHTDSKTSTIYAKQSGNNFGQALKKLWENAKYDKVLQVISDPYCFNAKRVFEYLTDIMIINNENTFMEELKRYGFREINKDDNYTTDLGNKVTGRTRQGEISNPLSLKKWDPTNKEGEVYDEQGNNKTIFIHNIKDSKYNLPHNDDDNNTPPIKDFGISRAKQIHKAHTIDNENANALAIYNEVMEGHSATDDGLTYMERFDKEQEEERIKKFQEEQRRQQEEASNNADSEISFKEQWERQKMR